MLRLIAPIAFLTLIASPLVHAQDKANQEDAPVPAALDFTVNDIDGNPVKLADRYRGKVVLMVNVASRCGLTRQYEQLQSLHEKYSEQGLAIAGFPANNFGGQEPGSNEEIKAFCTGKYDVGFDMYAKVSVKGDDQCELYKHLTAQETQPTGAGDISWNFEKFLLSRDGRIVARFAPKVKPDDEAVIKAIEAELAKGN
jgi:glutathione peroxidase